MRARCWLAMLTVCCALAQTPPEDANVVEREAQRAFAARDYAAAARAFERLAVLRPDSAEVLNNLGVSCHFADQTARAVEVFERALRINPNLTGANLLLGMNYIRLDQPLRAVPHLEKVLERDSVNRDALRSLAAAHFAMREFAKAAGLYVRETRAHPDDAEGWYAMALCLESLAEDASRQLAKLGRDSVYHNRLVGDYLLDQDPNIDAEQAFRRAIAAARGEELRGLHARAALAHLRLGELKRAEEEAAVELKLHPRDPDGELASAAVAVERGEYGGGVHRLCELRNAEPGFLLANLPSLSLYWTEKARAGLAAHLEGAAAEECGEVRALLKTALGAPESLPGPDGVFEPAGTTAAPPARLCRAGRFYAAFEAAGALLKQSPGNLEALYWQAESARRLAKPAFQRAVRLQPDSWQAHLLLGDIYRQRSDWEQAATHYREAAQKNPGVPAPQLGLATIEWENGRFEQAEPMLRKVLEANPGNAQAHLQLGDICVRQHRFEEAVKHLEQTIARSPEILLAHADLGKAYAGLDRLPEAEAEFVRSLPMDRYGNLHYQLSVVYRRRGKDDLAAKMMARSREIKATALAEREQRQNRYLGAAAESTGTE